jgi:hypothetical protein
MSFSGHFKHVVFLVLGTMLVGMIGVVPAMAQCMLIGWMRGGYCYDWGNMFSGKTERMYSSGGRSVEARPHMA